MTPLIIGNWKLNGSIEMIKSILQPIADAGLGENVVVCPPTPYLLPAHDVLKSSKVRLGAQDVSQYAQGAYTGEVSAAMLKDVGCSLTLVGHSERRGYFGENTPLLRKKVEQALEVGLEVVFCVGERLEVREEGNAIAFVLEELQCLRNLPPVIVAYEPVWAIGTGRTATTVEIAEVHCAIKAAMGENVPVLYGGSVKADNAASILAIDGVDGLLIGGASLKAEEFMATVPR
jgi:triosephosphate isomerase